MRLLVWPTYSYAGNVGADSLYLIARNLLRELDVEDRAVLVVPDWANKDVADDLTHDRRIEKIQTPMAVLYRAQEALADPETAWAFSPQEGLPIDAVISMSPARSLSLANAWSIRTTDRPAIVNWDLLVRDDRSGEMTTDEVELMQMAAGCWAADLNVFESPIARKMTLDVCRKHLSGSAVMRVMETSVDVPQGISVDRLMEIVERTPKREKFTVYYGGRFSTSKRVEEVAEVIDAFYRYGRDVEFVVTTGSLDGQKRAAFVDRFPQVELHVGKSQEEAWEIMAGCHASICFSTHELFGMAYWEQVAAGLAVVMKQERWNEDLMPPDYAYGVRTALEAAAILRDVHARWRDGQWLIVPWLSEQAIWVRENYDASKNLRTMLGHVRRLVLDHREAQFRSFEGGSRSSLIELASEVLTEGMPWVEYIARMREASRVGTNVVGQKLKWARSHTTFDAYRAAQYLGWQDAGDGLEPIWRRTGG